MKAVIVEKPSRLSITDIPKPKPSEHEILLKVRTASICNATDVRILEGKASGYLDHYPQILGHEVNGEVISSGSKVKNAKIGERIVCYKMFGGFCEYVTIDSREPFAKLPDEIGDEEAPLCEMFHGSLVCTVFPAHIRPWERVLIIGQGPMGLTTSQCVKALKVASVASVDLYKNRLEKAKEFRVDHTYDRSKMTAKEIVDKIKKEIGPIDLSIMCIDVDKSPERDAGYVATEALKHGGRLTGLSVEVKERGLQIDLQKIFEKNLKVARELYDIYDSPASISQAWQQGVNWVRDGVVNMKALISAHVSLEDVHRGLMLCKNKPDETIKVVVHVGV
jgi:threonine dehydrogenase-like Zn-dependent dehydrogenase